MCLRILFEYDKISIKGQMGKILKIIYEMQTENLPLTLNPKGKLLLKHKVTVSAYIWI